MAAQQHPDPDEERETLKINQIRIKPGGSCPIEIPGDIIRLDELPGDEDFGALERNGNVLTFKAGQRPMANTRFMVEFEGGSNALDLFVDPNGDTPQETAI